MKIVSWNVNGLRSAMRKGLTESLLETDADIICLQEVKSEQQQLRAPVLTGYQEHWNSSTTKKGYSGTQILSRDPLLKVSNDLDSESLDGDGRVIIAELEHFILINVYAPNSQSGLKRLPFRLDWDQALQDKMFSLVCYKRVRSLPGNIGYYLVFCDTIHLTTVFNPILFQPDNSSNVRSNPQVLRIALLDYQIQATNTMLICLFAAFLFFVVRQPTYDTQQPSKTAYSRVTPLLRTVGRDHSIPKGADFEHPEERQAA